MLETKNFQGDQNCHRTGLIHILHGSVSKKVGNVMNYITHYGMPKEYIGPSTIVMI